MVDATLETRDIQYCIICREAGLVSRRGQRNYLGISTSLTILVRTKYENKISPCRPLSFSPSHSRRPLSYTVAFEHCPLIYRFDCNETLMWLGVGWFYCPTSWLTHWRSSLLLSSQKQGIAKNCLFICDVFNDVFTVSGY
jgi:hypothetical protein